jgi:hypothetical protein
MNVNTWLFSLTDTLTCAICIALALILILTLTLTLVDTGVFPRVRAHSTFSPPSPCACVFRPLCISTPQQEGVSLLSHEVHFGS